MTLRLTLACATISACAALFIPGAAQAEPVIPDFSAATFVPGAPIDNTYYPLVPGTIRRYEADVVDPDEPEGETEELVIEDFVTFNTVIVNGVTAREVRAREFIDGLLIEDTRDWFAQDTAGNVWYLGETTTEFEYDDEGNQIGSSTEGSWRAGENGAQAGFIMPANRTVGFNYFQEHAPNDDALDHATIVALDESITVPAGSFDDVLDTTESSTADPDEFEHKFYAPGVGLILIEEDFVGGEPLNSIPLVEVTVVPLPPAVVPGLASVGALMIGGVWRRRRARA
jgi:hypothetical protein